MGLTLDTLYAQANRLLLNNDSHALGILSEADRKLLIKDVIRVYSKKRPLVQLEAYTGTSDDWYDLPAAWDDGFSSIYEIEYPIENSPKDTIAEKDYYIDLMSGGKKLRFNRNNPKADATFWVKFLIRHTFDSLGDSEIPESDQTAIAYLIMSIWCEAFATHFASKADPSLAEAEAITYTSRVDEYTGKARDWNTKYNNELKDEYTGTYGKVGFLQDPYWDRDND